MSSLNFKHLRYFLQVADTGSIARASEQLHISPQTISEQLQQLEDQLGGDLFNRQGRRLALTDKGRMVQGYAREIFTLGEHICDEYLSGSAPLQRYVIARSMLHDFLWSYAEFIDAWAERSLARIDAWNDESVAEQHRAALEAYRVHTHLARPEPADIPVHDFHGDSVGDSIKGQS